MENRPTVVRTSRIMEPPAYIEPSRPLPRCDEHIILEVGVCMGEIPPPPA
jgi:hypothetical protein